MSFTVKTLKKYITNDLNILVSGPAGTGKTAKLTQACEELGLSLKYYQAALLDPFVEFMGIPVPNYETKSMEYYRGLEILDAEVIMFDELNRADARTLNTLFEIIQFRTVNKTPLPKLRCVVAAINPPTEDYTVDDLDLALVDRFDVYLSSKPSIDRAYFIDKYGEAAADVVVTWWNNYNNSYKKSFRESDNKSVYLSPRRMDKMVHSFKLIPEMSTLQDTLPVGAVADLNDLRLKLNVAFDISKDVDKDSDLPENIAEIMRFEVDQLKSDESIEKIVSILNSEDVDKKHKDRVVSKVSILLGRKDMNMKVSDIVLKYWSIIRVMKPSQEMQMTNGWSIRQREQYHDAKLLKKYADEAFK